MEQEISSYTSGQGGGAISEFVRLFKRSRRAQARMGEEVADLLRMIRESEALVREHTGMTIEGLKILEIGPGQLPREAGYFAVKNEVIGVDLDVIPTGFNIPQYLSLLRNNGPKRLLKTVARKAMGFDRKYTREMARQLGLKKLPKPTLRQMDATKLAFPPATFDFVYSFAVFEHLPDPGAVLEDVKRVLKPGGVCYTNLHLFTCDNGGHDLRIRGGDRNGVPYWPHLRPETRDKVQQFAYINKLRLPQWTEIFNEKMPGCRFAHDMDAGQFTTALAEARAKGELAEYSDEELLTHNFICVWQKPR
jgi:SAM-dependent methyltransferase